MKSIMYILALFLLIIAGQFSCDKKRISPMNLGDKIDWDYRDAIAICDFDTDDDMRPFVKSMLEGRSNKPLFVKLQALVDQFPGISLIICEIYAPNTGHYTFEVVLDQKGPKGQAISYLGRDEKVKCCSFSGDFDMPWKLANEMGLLTTGGNCEIGSRITDGNFYFYTFRREKQIWQNFCYSPLIRLPEDTEEYMEEWRELFKKTNRYQILRERILKLCAKLE